MSETDNLALPLVEAAQAQKHVTVNEAFQRLDGLTMLRLEDVDVVTPPVLVEGAYAIGSGATGLWAGQDGRIAFAANGGWDFATPLRGWRAWVNGTMAVYDGTAWQSGAVTLAPNGSGMAFETQEFDHTVSAGPNSDTAFVLPAQTLVFGVTGRVVSDLGGAASGFSLGVSGATDRYGSGIGVTSGSYLSGITAAPQAYYIDTALTLTASSGDFGSGGVVRLAVHLMRLNIPGL